MSGEDSDRSWPSQQAQNPWGHLSDSASDSSADTAQAESQTSAEPEDSETAEPLPQLFEQQPQANPGRPLWAANLDEPRPRKRPHSDVSRRGLTKETDERPPEVVGNRYDWQLDSAAQPEEIYILQHQLPTVEPLLQHQQNRIKTLYGKTVHAYNGKNRQLALCDVITIRHNHAERQPVDTQGPSVRKALKRSPFVAFKPELGDAVGVIAYIKIDNIVLMAKDVENKTRYRKWNISTLETKAKNKQIELHGYMTEDDVKDLFWNQDTQETGAGASMSRGPRLRW